MKRDFGGLDPISPPPDPVPGSISALFYPLPGPETWPIILMGLGVWGGTPQVRPLGSHYPVTSVEHVGLRPTHSEAKIATSPEDVITIWFVLFVSRESNSFQISDSIKIGNKKATRKVRRIEWL